jgi:acyl-CoA synthetase (AMP-forming)/AMP-acid ligase II
VTAWLDEDERETVTFGEFRRRAYAHAAALHHNGVIAGDRVVLIMPQGIAAMTSFVGAMILGAIPAFLAYPNFKIESSKFKSGLAGVTANLDAKAVIIDDEFPDEMLGHVSLGEEAKLLRAGSTGAEDSAAKSAFPLPEISGDSLAFIQHSAGTTGLQKGVALTHAAVLRQLGYLSQALKINENADRIYNWLPLYHDMGLIACFMLPMVCHIPVVLQSPLDWVMHPETMLQIIDEYKCTLAWLPNFAFQFAARRTPAKRRTQYDLSSVRALINCSEPVRAKSMSEFCEAFSPAGLKSSALLSSYAMAENVFAVTQSAVDHGPARLWADSAQFRGAHQIVSAEEGTPGALIFVSSGLLLPNHEIRIISDTGVLLSDKCVGEILVKSDCLLDGYYNRPDLTAQALVDGWYRTGDLGFLSGGELFVVGRKKDLLIIGGENIYPQDIEEIVSGHPTIHDGRAIALGVYNPDLGTEDIVVVAEVEHEELLAHAVNIESEIRSLVVSSMGVAIRTTFLKPPKWIVKSTAGKAARSATLEKLLLEHPELQAET